MGSGYNAGSSDDECTAEELAAVEDLERQHKFQQSECQLAVPPMSATSAAAAEPLGAHCGISRPASGAAHPGVRMRSHPGLDGLPCEAVGRQSNAAACHSGSSCDSGMAGDALPQVCGSDLCIAYVPVVTALTALITTALRLLGGIAFTKFTTTQH